jgi:hypothetical protein
MTLDQIKAAWIRYMHRTDIEADLGDVEAYARSEVGNRLMGPTADQALTDAPQTWLHAGLVYLHELAADDDGLAREAEMFTNSCRQYNFRYSIDQAETVAMEEG